MATSTRRSSGPVLPFRRSISPRGGCTASAFASSSSSFTAHSPASFFHHRSASRTRVHFVGASPPPTPSVRLSFDRSTSPGRSLAAPDKRSVAPAAAPARRTCLCSPSTHPGSFRCSLHKGLNLHHHGHVAAASPSNRLNARRSAMTNSLVRIGAVEGEWVKRALAALIRPSSHQQRRRAGFQPRPSRLSRISANVFVRSVMVPFCFPSGVVSVAAGVNSVTTTFASFVPAGGNFDLELLDG
ncbi:Serine-rich [Musa troglodytarum]|uniref:Serine-rich n=1 Tax=Musa troglodytarum TaxID=320322 RepID=A0A9E7G9I1_9LILI|nr:Serine-rich [Musa troglodytarum]